MSDDRRLIEDYLPIQAISKEASREKSVRKGHISTLHLWWARRPLVACRAAVYGALVPADQFRPKNGPPEKRDSLARANAAKFVEALCKYPGSPKVIAEAQRHILDAHAERLTAEDAEAAEKEGREPKRITVEDILEGRAPRPKVLDMFAGGGAIPLEALRLGCDAYALDLNPVAHIIELCTLVYPQKYGRPDPTARGMTGPPAPRRYWAYVIRCADESFYIGQTDNIVRRYEDHCSGKVEWTASHKPVELIHWEEFSTREEAVAREHDLKTGFGRTWLKREWNAGRLASRKAGPKNEKGLPTCLERQVQPGETTWGGLAEEVGYWGNWVLKKVKAEIGDLYPLIPDPAYKGKRPELKPELWKKEDAGEVPPGYLVPVAYLWTRTVRCKNSACGATVPLVRQTWLCKKQGRYAALRMVAPRSRKRVRFEVVGATTEKDLGFDPSAGSKGGNATCPFCGTVADSGHIKAEGQEGRLSAHQLLAVVCTRPGNQGKKYLSADDFPGLVPDSEAIRQRIEALCARTGLTVPGEPMPKRGTLGFRVQAYGVNTWGDLFAPRQMLCLLSFAAAVRKAEAELEHIGHETASARAVITYLATGADREAEDSSALCRWNPNAEKMQGTFGRQALPMVWDFCETSPFGGSVGDWVSLVDLQVNAIEGARESGPVSAHTRRGSAMAVPWPEVTVDAVITDPPYYDNVPYADISDFFYVWLKRTIGHVYPEHFAAEGTPKKAEAVAEAMRYGGSMEKARGAYEEMMAQAFREAHRVLKPGAPMVVVYAHKTTLGWATLVDALRVAGFTVTEAWPLSTEMKTRLRGMDSAALASSIFLIARKRTVTADGSYEQDVRPELEATLRERVRSLWDQGIAGADLKIAAVGAGMRAFTRFARVEYANGEEVPAEKFLAEVEGLVQEMLLERIFGVAGLPAASRGSAAQAGSGVAGVDGPSRFYVLWRYTYKAAELDAGEAIVFTYGQPVELDGPKGLSTGSRALLEKKKGKYRLRDFTERGEHEKLGLRDDGGNPAPLVDALHRILWLVERQPRKLNDFLDEARPDRERLRLVAEAVAGSTLSGKSEEDAGTLIATTAPEQAALKKLLQNWRSLIEQQLVRGPLFDGKT